MDEDDDKILTWLNRLLTLGIPLYDLGAYAALPMEARRHLSVLASRNRRLVPVVLPNGQQIFEARMLSHSWIFLGGITEEPVDTVDETAEEKTKEEDKKETDSTDKPTTNGDTTDAACKK